MHCSTRLSTSTPVTVPQFSPAFEYFIFLLQTSVTFVLGGNVGAIIVLFDGLNDGISSWSSMSSSRDAKSRLALPVVVLFPHKSLKSERNSFLVLRKIKVYCRNN